MSEERIAVYPASFDPATNGHMDGVATAKVQAFEEGLLRELHDAYPEIGREIVETGQLSDETTGQLENACKKFREHFDRAAAKSAESEQKEEAAAEASS